jgi:hypothetical protein
MAVKNTLRLIVPVVLAVTAPSAEPAGPVDDAATIISRSIAANEADWVADPLYDRCERDDDGGPTQTYDVTMIQGRPYERLVAVGDRPLSPQQAGVEQRKHQQESARRAAETTSGGTASENNYDRRHARLHAIIQEFPKAFTFALDGKQQIGGRMAYHVTATPRPGYVPPTRDARALTGMTADFWVDVETYHWIRLSARITRSISLAGLLVRLEPGTTVELDKAAVDGDRVWLATRLQIRSISRILVLFGHHTSHEERYFGFRRSSAQTTSSCQEPPPDDHEIARSAIEPSAGGRDEDTGVTTTGSGQSPSPARKRGSGPSGAGPFHP